MMKRLFVLAALMMAFAMAPAFADHCGNRSNATATAKLVASAGA